MTKEQDFFALYDSWHQSPQGSFALHCGLNLTKKMLSSWPRRGHSFLQIYFDSPKTLEWLWQSGFDVSAVAPSAHLIHSMDVALQQRVEMHALTPRALDNLPFNDKSFDYVALMLPPIAPDTSYPPLHALLQEALRLAIKGVLYQGWNPCSMAGVQMSWKKSAQPDFLQGCSWHNWKSVYTTLYNLSRQQMLNPAPLSRHLGNMRLYSSLLGTVGQWGKNSLTQKIQGLIVPAPVGALMQIRCHLVDHTAMTSTPLRIPPLSATMQAVPAAKRTQAAPLQKTSK